MKKSLLILFCILCGTLLYAQSPLSIHFTTKGGTDGTCDGITKGTVTGGKAPYQYVWQGTSNTTDSIDKLCLGWQVLKVTDANAVTYKDSTLIDTLYTYDYKKGAYVIPTAHDWKSKTNEFTTVGATPDGIGGTCGSGPKVNRWFKFPASTNLVDLRIYGGSMYYDYYAAVMDSTGKTLACKTSADVVANTLSFMVDSLTPGEWYYITIDIVSSWTHWGTFSISLNDTLDYDYKQAAYVIPTAHDWKSKTNEFTTVGATPDDIGGTCGSGPKVNRWFKFPASTNLADLRIYGGSMYYDFYAAIMDSTGKTLACKTSGGGIANTLSIVVDSLTPGDWYYITIDIIHSTTHWGTFSISLNDTLDYDYKQAAYIIPTSNNYKSKTNEFTTVGATPDGTGGICGSGPKVNRWFKFPASTDLVDLRIYGGSMYYDYYVAIMDSTGKTLACKTSAGGIANTLSIVVDSLTPGDWYYITIDVIHSSSHWGTFSMSLDDTLDYDYKEGAYVIPTTQNWYSQTNEFTTIGATPDGPGTPCKGSTTVNRWFSFISNTTEIDLSIISGSMYYDFYISLQDESGNSLSCEKNIFSLQNRLRVVYDSLVIGKKYYIMVDVLQSSQHAGTFSLIINDKIDYDIKKGAKPIPHLDSYKSNNGEFTTIGATPDESRSSCQSSGPFNNRWHTFIAATPSIYVAIRWGGSAGTIRNPYIALWDDSGNLVRCMDYTQTSKTALGMYINNLTVGKRYYVSVDNTSGSAGSYILYADSDFDYSIPNTTFNCRDGLFELPLYVRNPIKNVQGMDIALSYDTQTIEATSQLSLVNGILNSDSARHIIRIDSTKGKIYLSLYTLGKAFSGRGLLFNLKFRTKTSLHNGTQVKVEKVTESYVSGVDSLVYSYSGVIKSKKDPLFDGSIQFWKRGAPLGYYPMDSTYQPVNITGLNGNGQLISSSATQNDSMGNFHFNTDYSEKVVFERDVADSANIMPVINGADALLVKKVLIADQGFTPNIYQMMAMDVNQDGQVTAGDLTQLSKRTIGRLTEFQQSWNYNNDGTKKINKASRDWIFLNPDSISSKPSYTISATYPKNDRTGFSASRVPVSKNEMDLPVDKRLDVCFSSAKFTAVLMGDVDGNFVSKKAKTQYLDVASEGELLVDVIGAPEVEDGYSKIVVTLKEPWDLVHSIDFQLNLLGSSVDLDMVQENSNIESMYSFAKGHLSLTSYSLETMPEGEVLWEFLVKGTLEPNYEGAQVLINGKKGHLQIQDLRKGDPVGVEGLATKLDIYPNPATDQLKVEMSESGPWTLEVYDVIGNRRLTQLVNEKAAVVDLSGLIPGHYILQVVSANDRLKKHFVKL